MANVTPHTDSPNVTGSGLDPDVFLASQRYFQKERREEARKRFATWALLVGLLSLLLFVVPNPLPWLAGPVAVVLGIHALIRVALQPDRYGGTKRALVGIAAGLIATAACSPWINTIMHHRRLAICASNLQGVAQGLHIYHDRWGEFPPDLQTLIQAGGVTPEQCQCPLDGESVDQRPDFAYVAGLQPDDQSDWVWLYCDRAVSDGGAGVILYLSGQTERLDAQTFAGELRRFSEEYERKRGLPPAIDGAD